MSENLLIIYKSSIDSLRVAADFLAKEKRDQAANTLLSMNESIDLLQRKSDESFVLYKQSYEGLYVEAKRLHQERTVKNNAIRSLQGEIDLINSEISSLQAELDSVQEEYSRIQDFFDGLPAYKRKQLEEMRKGDTERLLHEMGSLEHRLTTKNNELIPILEERRQVEVKQIEVDVLLKENNYKFVLANNAYLFFGRISHLLTVIDDRLDDLKDLVELLDKSLTIADRFGVEETMPLQVVLERFMQYIDQEMHTN